MEFPKENILDKWLNNYERKNRIKSLLITMKIKIKMLFYCIPFILTSCDITKRATKSKNDVQATETIKTQIKRVGDTLRIEVPKITYKDTTIVKTNYVNRTEARITYDSKGNASVDCISAEINQFREEFRTLIDKSKDKESEKEENFDSKVILYGMLGLAVIVLGALFIGLNFLGKQTKATNTLLSAVADKLK